MSGVHLKEALVRRVQVKHALKKNPLLCDVQVSDALRHYYVTGSEGTGVVLQAPGFCEDGLRSC